MKTMHALLLASLLVTSGCGVGAVSPIVGEADRLHDQALVGSWVDAESEETAVITARGGGGYSVVYTESDGRTGRFAAELGSLGAHRILELRPFQEEGAGAMHRSLSLRLHTLLFLDSVGDEISFRAFEPDSLQALLQREPGAVRHLMTDDLLVLTAPTPALRQFLLRFAERPGVMTEPMTWKRRSATSP
jgi:hypothetical protein